jgi:hypothetical protein
MMAVAVVAVIVTMTMTVARAETVTTMMTHRPALAQVSEVLSPVHRLTLAVAVVAVIVTMTTMAVVAAIVARKPTNRPRGASAAPVIQPTNPLRVQQNVPTNRLANASAVAVIPALNQIVTSSTTSRVLIKKLANVSAAVASRPLAPQSESLPFKTLSKMVPPSPPPLALAVVHDSSKRVASVASSSRSISKSSSRHARVTSASPSRRAPFRAASSPVSKKLVKPCPRP